MKSRAVPISEILAPLRAAAQHFSHSALILVSIGVIALGKADSRLVERARNTVSDFATPLLNALTEPVAAARSAIVTSEQLLSLYRENEQLRAENAALMQWQQVARRLDAENVQLRALTLYQPDANTFFVSAQVIGTAGGAFSRNLLINRGTQDGVAKGQAAATGIGLIGRIAEIGERSSRVLLLTDINSRIPVAVESTRERAILAGDNSDLAQLVYLSPSASVKPGDRIVTSGDGGVFPPGIPVGEIASVQGSQVRVAPLADLNRVEYVRIIDFGLGGVLPPGAAPVPKPTGKLGLAAKP